MNTFVCFGTAAFASAQRTLLADAAATRIFNRVLGYGEDDIVSSPEYATLAPEIARGRAFGYFWWKPYIIRRALESSPPGGLVFYSDVGRYDGGFRLGPRTRGLIERYASTGFAGVEVPQFGPNQRWTHEDCFQAMGCTEPRFRTRSQTQATFSLWRNDENGRSFVKEWEMYCRMPAVLSETERTLKNHSSFIAHRHDQSVLTNLVIKHDFPAIRVAGPLDRIGLRLIGRSYEAHTAFKSVEFVAGCLEDGRLWRDLLKLRLRRKSLVIFSFPRAGGIKQSQDKVA